MNIDQEKQTDLEKESTEDFQELMIDGILHDNNSLRESFDNRTHSSSTCMSKKSQSNYTFDGSKSSDTFEKKELVFFEEALLKPKIKLNKLRHEDILLSLDSILLKLKK